MADAKPREIKRYYKISELQQKALNRFKEKEIFVKGYDCGFKSGDDYISYRTGYSTAIYSHSAQGKSQFLIEQLVHLSNKYELKHAIWLTENGAKDELTVDIAMTYLKKSVFGGEEITDKDILRAYEWMEKYFYIIDHESSMLNVRDIYESVLLIEKEQGVKINTVSIDNASNLSREADKAKMMIHEYMAYLMTSINRTSLAKNFHTFILFHVNPTDLVECKDTKRKYMGKPTHYHISGGSQVNYLGYQLINIWRPVTSQEMLGIVNPETGIPFQLNEAVITVSKSKPKKVGTTGSFSLYFDTEKQCYYELQMNKKFYSGQYEEQQKLDNPTNNMPISKLF